jgi:hypothetical protein
MAARVRALVREKQRASEREGGEREIEERRQGDLSPRPGERRRRASLRRIGRPRRSHGAASLLHKEDKDSFAKTPSVCEFFL